MITVFIILTLYLIFIIGLLYAAHKLQLTIEERERIRQEMIRFYSNQQRGE